MSIKNIKFGLRADLIKEIICAISSYKEVEKIILFGSRAVDCFKKTSDIDLAVIDSDWDEKDINLMKNILEETIKTPLKFDLLNVKTIDKDELKSEIISKGIVIYESGKN